MRSLLLSLFSLLLLADVSSAQNSMLAGKIVGEDGMPIAGAKIEIKRGHKVTETKSDDDGLFYSKLLPVGNYHIRVVVGEKQMKAKSVYLPDETRKKSFYYLRVVNDIVIVTMDADDPFLKAKLTRIESGRSNIIDETRPWSIEAVNKYNIIDGVNPLHIVTIKSDTTGNIRSKQ